MISVLQVFFVPFTLTSYNITIWRYLHNLFTLLTLYTTLSLSPSFPPISHLLPLPPLCLLSLLHRPALLSCISALCTVPWFWVGGSSWQVWALQISFFVTTLMQPTTVGPEQLMQICFAHDTDQLLSVKERMIWRTKKSSQLISTKQVQFVRVFLQKLFLPKLS